MNKCQTCGSKSGSCEPHSCPYNSEINEDDSEICNCCSECIQNCCDEI